MYIAIVGADRLLDGNQVCSCWKGPLDLQLGKRHHDGWVYMSAAEDTLPHFYEVGDGVASIANGLIAP